MASWEGVVFLPEGQEVARAIERLSSFGVSLPPGASSLVTAGAIALLVIEFAALPRHSWRTTVAALLSTASATPGCLGVVIDWDASRDVDEWVVALRSPELWPPDRRMDTPLVLARLAGGATRLRLRPDAFFLRG